MRRNRNARSLAAATLLVAVSLGACAPAFAQDRERERELMLTETFELSGQSLLIEVADADVMVRNGTGNRITFEVWLSAKNLPEARERYERMNFRADASSGTISLRSDADQNTWNNWDWRRWGGFDVIVEATVPENIDTRIVSADGDISLQSLSGHIVVLSEDGDITADALTGDVHLETEDGDVGVRAISGSRLVVRSEDGDISVGELDSSSIEIHTADGDIHGKHIAGETMNVRTDDGDIIVDAVAGALAAQTHDGDIHISIERLEDTSLRTGDGDITIRASDSLAADLDLRGSELTVRSGGRFDGRLNGRIDHRAAQGRLNGGGPTLEARTGEGTIVLRLQGT